MSRTQLKESLREKGETRGRAIWEEAEQKANRYRLEAEAHYRNRQQQRESECKADLTQELEQLVSRAEKKLQRIRLQSEEIFSQRLWQLACKQLVALLAAERDRSLQSLAAELPGLSWAQITVHPHDRQQAEKLFAGALIDTDPALIGGLIAVTADNAIAVDNSLVKRLTQLWPQLCGNILDALETLQEGEDAQTSA
ncbi:MAG: hypothetical protein IBX47_05720 [Desulfuromonadales bacterium]|nr:hypothetical protein [Desulfuromonadales bacterium]